VHALISLQILIPISQNDFKGTPTVGGGGPGPAGGGGGGSSGDRLQFIQLKTSAADAAARVVVPPKPIVAPKPAVAVPPPSPVQPPAAAAPAVTATSPGAGTGTGTAGTAGAGPGSGGGIGSGIGTGTGSSNGPGTGGGPGKSYPPTPTQFFLPPLPAPSSLKGFHLTAYFDVDEKGNAKLLGFNQSRDGDYNRKLRDVLMSLRFRPGVKADGTPVRDTVDIQFLF
jgi:protein TonB